MAKSKAKPAPKRRSKITLEIPADLKRRLLCYAGSRDEHVWRVVERAVERELGGFYFAMRGPAELPTADGVFRVA